MNTTIVVPGYTPPPFDECEESRYDTELSSDDRLSVRMVTAQDGKWLVDFALMHQTSFRGHWHDVARYDCAHGSVHFHQLYRSGKPEAWTKLFDIPGVGGPQSWEIIGTGYDRASDEMTEQWEERVKRWTTS